ncbi:unnamed protein product [Lampetra fluviatilis]
MPHSRLAELLQATASIVAELHREESAAEGGAPERRESHDPAAIYCQVETSVVQPALTAAILPQERSAQPAKSEVASKASNGVAHHKAVCAGVAATLSVDATTPHGPEGPVVSIGGHAGDRPCRSVTPPHTHLLRGLARLVPREEPAAREI